MEGEFGESSSLKPSNVNKRAGGSTLSVVWNYFNLDETKGRVICHICKQEMCYNRNTSAMTEHLKRKHVYVKLNEEKNSSDTEAQIGNT